MRVGSTFQKTDVQQQIGSPSAKVLSLRLYNVPCACVDDGSILHAQLAHAAISCLGGYVSVQSNLSPQQRAPKQLLRVLIGSSGSQDTCQYLLYFSS